jgi:hypothetical protein
MCRVGRCAEAADRFETALLGDDYRLSLFANVGLANVELSLGEPRRAKARLEHILPKLEGLPTEDLNRQGIAEARMLLARASAALGEHERVPALLSQARAEFEVLAVPQALLDELAHIEDEAVDQ